MLVIRGKLFNSSAEKQQHSPEEKKRAPTPASDTSPKMSYTPAFIGTQDPVVFKRQVIVSMQEPEEKDLHTKSDKEFSQAMENPKSGVTAEELFRRDKQKGVKQELVVLPRNPGNAAPLQTALHEDHIKMYLIGQCKQGAHTIKGTGGEWSVADVASYIMQSLTKQPAKKIIFRINICAPESGLATESNKSFAAALRDILCQELERNEITNVELQIVARVVVDKNEDSIAFTNTGETRMQVIIDENALEYLELHRMLDQELSPAPAPKPTLTVALPKPMREEKEDKDKFDPMNQSDVPAPPRDENFFDIEPLQTSSPSFLQTLIQGCLPEGFKIIHEPKQRAVAHSLTKTAQKGMKELNEHIQLFTKFKRIIARYINDDGYRHIRSAWENSCNKKPFVELDERSPEFFRALVLELNRDGCQIGRHYHRFARDITKLLQYQTKIETYLKKSETIDPQIAQALKEFGYNYFWYMEKSHLKQLTLDNKSVERQVSPQILIKEYTELHEKLVVDAAREVPKIAAKLANKLAILETKLAKLKAILKKYEKNPFLWQIESEYETICDRKNFKNAEKTRKANFLRQLQAPTLAEKYRQFARDFANLMEFRVAIDNLLTSIVNQCADPEVNKRIDAALKNKIEAFKEYYTKFLNEKFVLVDLKGKPEDLIIHDDLIRIWDTYNTNFVTQASIESDIPGIAEYKQIIDEYHAAFDEPEDDLDNTSENKKEEKVLGNTPASPKTPLSLEQRTSRTDAETKALAHTPVEEPRATAGGTLLINGLLAKNASPLQSGSIKMDSATSHHSAADPILATDKPTESKRSVAQRQVSVASHSLLKATSQTASGPHTAMKQLSQENTLFKYFKLGWDSDGLKPATNFNNLEKHAYLQGRGAAAKKKTGNPDYVSLTCELAYENYLSQWGLHTKAEQYASSVSVCRA